MSAPIRALRTSVAPLKKSRIGKKVTTIDGRSLRIYKSYSFIDKDPVIDFTRTAVNDSGGSLKDIAETSGVSRTTLDNWFKRRTRRPQFATIAAVLRSVGVTKVDLDALLKGK